MAKKRERERMRENDARLEAELKRKKKCFSLHEIFKYNVNHVWSQYYIDDRFTVLYIGSNFAADDSNFQLFFFL